MLRKAIEISKIVTAILLMTCGLILMLRYLDGRLIIGAVLMISGIIMWVVLLKGELER